MSVVADSRDMYEKQYIQILKQIKSEGFRQMNERTGVETLRIPHAIISVDLEDEFPILKCKQVYWKSALKEILWIMQAQSNNINELDAHIWDDWADENGSIGKAYGYQVGKKICVDGMEYPSQVHYVLQRLSSDSSDRRGVIDLWNVDDMGEMNLVPCCYTSHWTVIDGRLNCMLMQRSADFLVGVPFNTTQYAMLTILFARHLGVQPGQITHCMSDAHIYLYDSHINGMEQMIENYYRWYDAPMITTKLAKELKKVSESFKLLDEVNEAVPDFVVESENNDFFSVNWADCNLENYKSFGKISFDVAV